MPSGPMWTRTTGVSPYLQPDPYLVTDALTDPRTAANPLVHGAMGVRFYAAAPITTADGHRLGTINVLDTRPRGASAADLATLQDLAAIVMDELELRLSAVRTLRLERDLRMQAERDRATIETFASTLQSTLLPPALPAIPGLELACYYHTASSRQVGGDFYDVVPLGSDRWAFFLGDVCGHGAQAAALTRYTLRAAAWHDPDPVSVLRELNTALALEPTKRHRFATVVFGVLEPEPGGDAFRVTLGSGGHEPVLWLQPGTGDGTGRVDEIRPEGGMLVGAFPDAQFVTRSLRLDRGHSLLLYTDGMIETPPAGGGLGADGLTRFLVPRVGRDAASLIGDLTALVESFDPAPTDDVALLVLRAPPAAAPTP